MHPVACQNFDLYIDPVPHGGYRAKVTDSPCGQIEELLQLQPEGFTAAGFPPWSAASSPRAAGKSQIADLLAAANVLFAPLLAGAVASYWRAAWMRRTQRGKGCGCACT